MIVNASDPSVGERAPGPALLAAAGALAIAVLALHAATWLPALWAVARTLQVPPRRDERLIALLDALPGLAYLVLWWPSLGVSHDMDLLLGAFPAGVAAAWLMSRTPRTAIVGLVLLALTHVLFWSVVAHRGLERVWIT